MRVCVCEGNIQQTERQEVLLRGAGTVVLIKAWAGDTMGGVPLFIHQPPISFGRVRWGECVCRQFETEKETEDTHCWRDTAGCVCVCV